MRFSIKKGDVFEISLKNQDKRYLQYLGNDENCLNGNVIRVFKYAEKTMEEPDLAKIVNSDVDFFCHTYLKGGIDMNVWKKVGNSPLEKTYVPPVFRHTDDVASVVSKSYNWFIWRLDQMPVKIGELSAEHSTLPVAGLRHPIDILNRLKTGKDNFKFPA